MIFYYKKTKLIYKIKFWLKLATSKEMNAIQSFALEIKTELMKLIPLKQIINIANEKIIK